MNGKLPDIDCHVLYPKILFFMSICAYSHDFLVHFFLFAYSSPFCLYLFIIFYATQFWIVSTSTWTLDVTLSINFKKYFAEAFFFFLHQKSQVLFIDSLRQSFLQYCWSPFGFWNTHPHWILRASSYSVYWALQDDLKKMWQNAFFFFSSFDKSLQLFIDSLRQRFL